MNLLARSWKGQASLALAFWVVFILFGLIISIILSWTIGRMYPNMTVAEAAYKTTAVQFPYLLFAAICVWRCAKNSIPLWRILARFIVLLYVLWTLFILIFGFEKLPSTTTQTTTTTTQTAPATTAAP